MHTISRRHALGVVSAFGAVAFLPGGLLAHELYQSLRGKSARHGLPDDARGQWATESPAPAAPDPGRWSALEPIPLPRSEMAWATASARGMHLIGGYGEQRVNTTHHHVFDPAAGRWQPAAPVPEGANHIGVVADGGQVYAIGGHHEQNRKPHALCFVYDIAKDRWSPLAPLPRACGAASVVSVGGRIHSIGGAIGDTNQTKKSVDWHEVYDPKADAWEKRAPLPVGRDHMGAVVVDGRIHVVAGRIDSARKNVDHHDLYLPDADRWERRASVPTPRSGHGAVLYRGRIFVMGGEAFTGRTPDGQLLGKVFGQNEAYDPKTDTWQHYAPMVTPRHGLGAAVVGDAIHVAGGAPVVGGRVQSAVHEAFRLG